MLAYWFNLNVSYRAHFSCLRLAIFEWVYEAFINDNANNDIQPW